LVGGKPPRRLRIVVDEHERSSGVPSILSMMNVTVEYVKLDVGDYVVSSELAVERKALKDMVSSIYDGRLFDQSSRLSSHYKKPILILEGDMRDIPELVRNPKIIYGALTSIMLNYNITMLQTPSPAETALALYMLADHSAKERRAELVIQKVRKSQKPGLQQLYIVSALPGVGEKLAKRLLERFKTPRGVFQASIRDIARVQGVGRARALKIRSALDTEFKTVFRQSNRYDALSPDGEC